MPRNRSIPGRGTLLYPDDATLQAALDNRMGEALGYGVDEKPATGHIVTARDRNGTVIQEIAQFQGFTQLDEKLINFKSLMTTGNVGL